VKTTAFKKIKRLGDAYGMLGQFWIDFHSGDALISLITGPGDDSAMGRGLTPM